MKNKLHGRVFSSKVSSRRNYVNGIRESEGCNISNFYSLVDSTAEVVEVLFLRAALLVYEKCQVLRETRKIISKILLIAGSF